MTMYRKLLLAALGAGLFSAPALADPPRDAKRAFQGVRQGRTDASMLERRVLPSMGGADYLGPEDQRRLLSPEVHPERPRGLGGRGRPGQIIRRSKGPLVMAIDIREAIPSCSG